jgi:hypothetical protein
MEEKKNCAKLAERRTSLDYEGAAELGLVAELLGDDRSVDFLAS